MPDTKSVERPDMDIITGPFKASLEYVGFRNVVVLPAELPSHVAEWVRGDDDEMTDQEISDVTPYFKATTDQGSFGIVMAAYLMLDTKEAGINAIELGDTEAPENTFLILLNTKTLERLKRLLETAKN